MLQLQGELSSSTAASECLLFAIKLELCATVIWKEHFVTLLHCNWDGVTTGESPPTLTDSKHPPFVVLHTNVMLTRQSETTRTDFR